MLVVCIGNNNVTKTNTKQLKWSNFLYVLFLLDIQKLDFLDMNRTQTPSFLTHCSSTLHPLSHKFLFIGNNEGNKLGAIYESNTPDSLL